MSDGTTGTVVTDGTDQAAPEEMAPEIVKAECHKCGAHSGNGSGEIDEAEVVFDDKVKRYVVRWRCKICGPSKRPLLAAETALAMATKLNAERDAQLAAAEKARAEDEVKFKAAIVVWQNFANGRVRVRFEICTDGEGNLLCSILDCPYCKGHGPAEMFVVVKTAKGWERVGLCVHQGAARRESKVPWSRLPWGNRETCEAEAKKRQDALQFFLDLWAGKAAERPTLVTDEKGRILCGVPGCGCKEPAQFGLVSERRLEKAGLCLPHAIAGRDANRQGARFFVDSLPDCDRHLNALEQTVRQFAHRLDCWAKRPERPARPKAPETTPASEAAKARNEELAKALREGKGLEAVAAPKAVADPIEAAAAQGDPVAAELRAYHERLAERDAAKAKNKGQGGKKKRDGKGKGR